MMPKFVFSSNTNLLAWLLYLMVLRSNRKKQEKNIRYKNQNYSLSIRLHIYLDYFSHITILYLLEMNIRQVCSNSAAVGKKLKNYKVYMYTLTSDCLWILWLSTEKWRKHACLADFYKHSLWGKNTWFLNL